MSLRFHGVKKAFGACVANKNVSFHARPGEIHALVGENGAGKSTAMNLLYGLYPHDSGEIEIFGKNCRFHSSAEAMQLGIGMVHQHFLLADTLPVWENLLLFAPRSISKEAFFEKIKMQSEKYGLQVKLSALVSELSVGERQKVEILKMLVQEPKILVFDEPTAMLSPTEVASFYSILADIKKEGRIILVITHRLPEVFRYCDEVTVLRAGETVFSSSVAQTTMRQISDQMVGDVFVSTEYNREQKTGSCVLEWVDVCILSKNQKLNLQVKRGEILGIAGVEGNGQSDIVKAILFPNQVIVSGSYIYEGENCAKLSRSELRKRGLAALPEDRYRDGMMEDQTLRENLLLGRQHRESFNSKFLFLTTIQSSRIEKKFTQELEEYDVRPRDLNARMGSLSGGNQQKAVFARELGTNPKFLLCPHPTRGVDIGAVQFLHRTLLKKRAEGMSILLISSDLDELMNLSDRIQVIHQGKLNQAYVRSAFDEKAIGAEMMGAGS